MNLKQIQKKLTDYFNSHAQISNVFTGDDYELAAETNLSYPIAAIEMIQPNSQISGNYINHTFRITICDRINPNIPEIVDEIYSDSLLIVDDFFAWAVEDEDFEYAIRTSPIIKINDAFPDRLAGIRFRITLTTLRSNICVAPMK